MQFLKYFTIIFFYLLFFGCRGNNKATQFIDWEEALNKAKNTEIIITRSFLDYDFNMSSSEVMDHTKHLIEQGQLKYLGDEITYEMFMSDGVLICSFGIDLFEDRISSLILIPKYDKENLFLPNDILAVKASNFYSSKYYDYGLTHKNINDELVEIYRIKDNHVIQFTRYPKSIIRYINAPIYKMQHEIENSEKENLIRRSADVI